MPDLIKTAVECSDVTPTFPGYPAAVKSGGLVFLSGIRGGGAQGAPTHFDELPAAGRSKEQGFALPDLLEGEVCADAWAVHEALEAVLNAAGTAGDQLLRQHIWQRDKRFFPCFENIRMHWQPVPAPSSGLGVARVAAPRRAWYGIDGIAVIPDASPLFSARRVLSAVDDRALPSASHYSQAVESGPFVFTAGFIAIKTSEPGKPLVDSFDDVPPEGRFLATGRSHPDSRDGPIAAQTWFVLNEIRRTLRQGGLELTDVANVTVYLRDVRDYATFHRIFHHMFANDPPALCVTGFDEVGHRGCRIEIEVTAVRPSAALDRRAVAWTGPAPFAAPAARRVGPLLFLSGMLGLDAEGRLAAGSDAVPSPHRAAIKSLEEIERQRGLAAQCWWALRRLEQALAAAGSRFAEVVKYTVYVGDLDDLAIYESVRRLFTDDRLVAFEGVVVHGPGGVPGAWIQVEAIGMLP